VAPTPPPTRLNQVALSQGDPCLTECQASMTLLGSSECTFYDHVFNGCPSFSTDCNAAEARTIKNRCLAGGKCTNGQCGVPQTAVVVETPAAAVLATLPIAGVSVAELSSNLNLQLALRSGVANALRIIVTDVLIKSMVALGRRRLGNGVAGVTVEFEITLVQIDMATKDGKGAVDEMTDKVATQAQTFDSFIKASAASLGVLDQMDQMSVDIGAITMKQGTVKSLPEPTPPLPAAEADRSTVAVAYGVVGAGALVLMALCWVKVKTKQKLRRNSSAKGTPQLLRQLSDNPMHEDKQTDSRLETKPSRSISVQDRESDRKFDAGERLAEHEKNLRNLTGVMNKKKRQAAQDAYEAEERRIAHANAKEERHIIARRPRATNI